MKRSLTVPPNRIQAENAHRGTRGWQLRNPATKREIEGYASATSVGIGGQIEFCVSTNDSKFTIEIFRTGWYGGVGARLLLAVNDLPGVQQPTPLPDPVTGLVECQWEASFVLTIPTTWTSGVFLARLTGKESTKQCYVIFVVRDDLRSSDLLFQSSVTTFQAYNFWPGGDKGKSLYEWAPGGRAWKVSFNRPYVLGHSYTPNSVSAGSGVGAGEYLTNLQPGPYTTGYPISPAGWEYNMVRWLERSGRDVTYMTNVDLHENGNLLMRHRAFLSVGHDEYWSMQMRKNLERALASGVSMGFFSANTMYWQIRFEPASDGKPMRTIVCYKDDAASSDPVFHSDPQLSTVNWRSDPVRLPEAAIIGVQYFRDPVNADIVISNASHPLLKGTNLKNGDVLPGLLGYEADTSVPGVSPSNLCILAASLPYSWADSLNATELRPNTIYYSHAVWYSADKAFVFATGSIQWSWGLDDYNAPALRPVLSSAAAQRITSNVLDTFTGRP